MDPSINSGGSSGLIGNESFGFSQSSINSAVDDVAKFAPVYQTPTYSSPFWAKQPSQPSPSALDQFFGKVGSVFGEAGHLIEGAAEWAGRTVAEGIMAVPHFAEGIPHAISDNYRVDLTMSRTAELNRQMDDLNAQFHSGRIDKATYLSSMNDIGKQLSNNQSDINGILSKTQSDEKQFISATVGTIADILTVASGGLGSPMLSMSSQGAKDAATYLMSHSADEIFNGVTDAMKAMAAKSMFKTVPQFVRNATKASITDSLIRAGAAATSKQAIRSAAINMAVKYPLAFNWIDGTGQQMASELQTGKYGDAVKTLGFNLGLLFAGGPVGDAILKQGPAAMKALSGRVFGTTSFIDTLSHGLFGDSSAIYNAIKDDPEATKAVQALEATNMAAADNRAGSAAYRVIDGLKQNFVPAFKDTRLTPKQFLNQYVMNWYKSQSVLRDALIKSGLSEDEARKYVVGRWTVYDANRVGIAVTTGKLAESDITPFMTGIDNGLPGVDRQITVNRTAEPANNYEPTPGEIKGYKALSRGNISTEQARQELINMHQPEPVVNTSVRTVKGNLQRDMLKNWQDLKMANPNAAFSNNATLDDQVTHIIKTSDNEAEVRQRISQIRAQTGNEFMALAKNKSLAKAASIIGKLGYTPIVPGKLEAPFIEGSQKLVSKYASDGEDFFQKAVKPFPGFGDAGAVLVRMGLSPERAPQATYELFTANFIDNLRNTTLFKGTALEGKYTEQEADGWARQKYAQLTDYINEKNNVRINLTHPPITDLRQLTRKEIGNAMKIGSTDAKSVQNAIMQSMLDISLAERGLGDKIIDIVSSRFPIMQKYLRLQGAGRFAWNPFFKMKVAYKTEFLAQLETGGKVPTVLGTNRVLRILFPKYVDKLDATDKLLSEGGMYGGGFSNEAANEATAGYEQIQETKGLLKSQRYSVAGLINRMADNQGMTAEDFIHNFPNETRDTIGSIIHYNPNADFLNSPLARTLNMAIFPFRFDVKVASFVARGLARQNWATRTAIINSLLQARDFLRSPQGQIWYSQNSDVIGLLEYFSPVAELKTVAAFGNIKDDSVGSFGMLGGLPVGFIPQILQAEGLWNPNGSYVNPKTGQPGTNYIPLTARAKLATALTSFMGSLFSYPGSEAGLPSKTGILSGLAEGMTSAAPNEWQRVPMSQLTPQQQQFEEIVQRYRNANQPVTQSDASSEPQAPQTKTVPQTTSATAQPVFRASGRSSGRKLKKDQEPVQLLPGQSRIGQIP